MFFFVFIFGIKDEIITGRLMLKKALINCLRGMKRKAHGTQEPRHIQKYVEVTSTAQRSDSPAQVINQRFLKGFMVIGIILFGAQSRYF